MLATVSLTILHQVYRQHKMDFVFVLFFFLLLRKEVTPVERRQTWEYWEVGVIRVHKVRLIKKNTTLENNKKGKEEEVERGEAMVVYLTC